MKEALEAIERLSAGMREVQAACLDLHARLVQLTTEVTAAGPAKTLGKVVYQFEQLLLKNQRYENNSFHVRCILYERIMNELRRLHVQANAISREPLDWMPTWENTALGQFHAMMERVVDAKWLVEEEKYTTVMMAEALVVIQFELERTQFDQNRVRHVLELLSNTIKKKNPDVPVPERIPKWFIPSYDVYLRYLIASGSFGTMHRAQWGDKPVLVKSLHTHANDRVDRETRELFAREIDACYGILNDHLVRVLGACYVSSPPFIVYQQAQKGNVMSFIARSKKRVDVWRLLYEAALGLQHLHRRRLIHGRLNIHNILIDAQGKAQISAYGLLRTRRLLPSRSSSSLRYRAPECRDGDGRETAASDVFSLAMCIVHAVTQQLPFGDLDNASILQGARIPDRPGVDVMSNEAWALVEKMTHAVPAARCSVDEVVIKLREFAKEQDTSSQEQGVVAEQPSRVVLPVLFRDGSQLTDGPESVRPMSERLAIQDTTPGDAVVEAEPFSHAALPASTTPAVPAMGVRGVHQLILALESVCTTSERLKILKLLCRRVQDEASHKKVGNAGYELLAKIVCRETSTWKESVYAFGLLDRAQRRWDLVLESKDTLEAKVKLPDQAALKVVKANIKSSDRATFVEACEMLSCLALVRGVQCRDAIGPLIAVLSQGRSSSHNDKRSSLKAIAAATLGYIALNSSYHQAIQDNNGIKWLVKLLKSGSAAEKTKAAFCFSCLTTMEQRDGDHAPGHTRLCEALHRAHVTRRLVNFLAGGSGGQAHGQLCAASALGNIAVTDNIRSKIIKAGAVKLLNDLIQRGNEEQKTVAVRTLSLLCQSYQLEAITFHEDGTLTSLYELLSNGVGKQKIWAIFAVYHLVGNPEARGRLQSCLLPLVAMMKSHDGTSTSHDSDPANLDSRVRGVVKQAIERLRANAHELQRSEAPVAPADAAGVSESLESSVGRLTLVQQSDTSARYIGHEEEAADVAMEDGCASSDPDYSFSPDYQSNCEIEIDGRGSLRASSSRESNSRRSSDSASMCRLDPDETTSIPAPASDRDEFAVFAAVASPHQERADQAIVGSDSPTQTLSASRQENGSHPASSDLCDNPTTHQLGKRKASPGSATGPAKKKPSVQKSWQQLGITKSKSSEYRQNQTIKQLLERLGVPLTSNQRKQLKLMSLERRTLSEEEKERYAEEAAAAAGSDHWEEIPRDEAFRMFELALSTDCDHGVIAQLSFVAKTTLRDKLATLRALFKRMQ